MVNILQITSNIKRNGPASVVLDLSRNYPEGYRAVIASAGGELEPKFTEKGIKCYTIPIGRTGNYLSYFTSFFKSLYILKKIIEDEKIDVIHCHQPVPILFGKILSKTKNKPLITTAHNIYNPKSIVQRQYSKGDKVVAVSEKVRKDQIESFGVDQNRVVTVLNGIDESHKRITTERETLRKELGLRADAFVVCTIAGLRKQKALNILLQAAEITTTQNANIQFLIVGNGEEYDSLMALRNELKLQDKVIFSGFRSDIYNVLNASDLFCLSSDYEGLPISILEAMLCGKPVVSTDVGGVNEVTINGETGLLCSKGDYKGLAEAILKLANDKELRERFSQKALQEVKTTFSARVMAQKYCEVYNEFLKK